MRSRKKPWAENEVATNEKVISEPEKLKGKWREYFGNENPIHMEIGSGKGRFIVETATRNRNINYISVERQKHVIVMGMRAARELDISLGFIIGDVEDLQDYFDEGEIKRIYINFCDPWQNRKKWHKRRLTHKNFLEMYKKLMNNHGEIFFKTDNTELFEFSLNQLSENGFRLSNITLDLHNSDYEGNVMTEYEEKFSKSGMPIYRCEAAYGNQKMTTVYENMNRYWEYVIKQDAKGLKESFTDDASIKWHDTNEKFTVDEFVRGNCEYPGKWHGEIESLEQYENRVITVVRVWADEMSFRVTSFFKMENGLIKELDEYWSEEGEAPEWRRSMNIGTQIKQTLATCQN